MSTGIAGAIFVGGVMVGYFSDGGWPFWLGLGIAVGGKYFLEEILT